MPGDRSMPMNVIDLRGEGGGGKPGAAAEIDGAIEEGRLARGGAHRQHRLEQQRRAAIVEVIQQRLHRSAAHIDRTATAHRPSASPPMARRRAASAQASRHGGPASRPRARGETQRSPRRCSPSCSRISPSVNQAEAKFGASSMACMQQIGGGNKIALQLQIAGKFEAAVGEQIAGGEKQARGHRGNRSWQDRT